MEGIRAEGLVDTHIVAEVVQEGVLESRFRFGLKYQLKQGLHLQEYSGLIVQGEFYRLQFLW